MVVDVVVVGISCVGVVGDGGSVGWGDDGGSCGCGMRGVSCVFAVDIMRCRCLLCACVR